jgi:hypothetical protein
MTEVSDSVVNQLRRNTVALVSIVIAVSSLSYNTWRTCLPIDDVSDF